MNERRRRVDVDPNSFHCNAHTNIDGPRRPTDVAPDHDCGHYPAYAHTATDTDAATDAHAHPYAGDCSRHRGSVLPILAILIAMGPMAAAAPLRQGGGGFDYIVVKDDWLSKLALKDLGDMFAYPAIAYYTNQKHAEDPSYSKITDYDLIEVGWKIYIPSAEEAKAYFASRAQTLGATTGETVKIGALAPLSAPGSVTGARAMKAAFEIALEGINAAGGVLGKPVELVLVDTEGLPERGTAAMERHITQEKVVGVVGEYHSAVGPTAKEVAHNYGIPVILPTPSAKSSTNDGCGTMRGAHVCMS